ncbi:MAG: asparagine synthase (glutamine-hydrolyzing) [Bacteroidetes bacterium]|nr:asparagine synthase (glutamine-hydrolyzing) [Bacteroidota bacterium]
MCGIFAAISIERPFNAGDRLRFDNALNRLIHRGPDAGQARVFSFNDQAENFNLYLGHRRLAIIDLDQKSNQPFEVDGLHIIFNGEIYNYLELRHELEKDFRFVSNSDTEVILRYYQKFGTAGFDKFNGMWAFVIYDSVRKKIVVSRDRFSVKPLYVHEENNQIFLSSEIKLLKTLNTTLSPNQKIIERFLNQMLIDVGGETFYNEITMFPAMTVLEIDLPSGKRNQKKYWDFQQPDMPASYAERKELFRSLLIDSLKLRLRSDVPLGTLLSGGLDSSAITALIHDHLNNRVQSFSVVADEKKYSEEKFVDLLIREKKINNHKLWFKTDLALENIQRVLDCQDEPYGSLSVVAQYLLFEKVRKEADITVLLSGQGADEVLLGYNKFFFFHLLQLKKQGSYLKIAGKVYSSFVKGTSVREFSWKDAKRYLPGRTNKGRDFFKKPLFEDTIWEFETMTSRQIQDISLYSIPQLTHYEDRNSMAHNIEVRLPFMDFRLVNFLIHSPVEDKLKGGWTKYLLRDAIHELPNAIRWRKDKKGFVTPEEEWLAGPLGQYIISYFQAPSMLEEMGILDREKYIHTVRNFRSHAKWLVYGDLFTVFITEMWLRENFRR